MGYGVVVFVLGFCAGHGCVDGCFVCFKFSMAVRVGFDGFVFVLNYLLTLMNSSVLYASSLRHAQRDVL